MPHRMSRVIYLLLASLLFACTAQEPKLDTEAVAELQAAEATRLNAWFQTKFDEDLLRYPEYKTYLGMTDDLVAYGKWNDPSEAAKQEAVAITKARLDEMRATFDIEKLPHQSQVSFKFAEFSAINGLAQAEFDDQGYVFTQFFGPHSDMSTLLIGYQKVENVGQAEAYLSRLESFGPTLNVHIDIAEQRAAQGVVPPRFAYPVVIESSKGITSGQPFDKGEKDSPLWADIKAKVAALDITDEAKAALLQRAKNSLLTSVKPAYERLITVMQKHAALAGPEDGIWKLPRGKAYYEAQLANYTTRDDMTAAQIHQLGLDEVERIQGEMREIMKGVGFEGDLQAFFKHLRESDEFYYSDDDAGRQQYLSEAKGYIDNVMLKAPAFFGALPKATLEVRAVEPYRIESATGAFYEPGSLDGKRPGAYYVNLNNMRELPVYQMESLAYHEGAPGHHFQSAIAQELQDVPMFQKLTWYSAYGEGWALYAEKLGKDMGEFKDPYQDFGRLSYEVFRAARLVVDTGIHSKRWTEKQAQDYMLSATPMTFGDIENEVRRYIVWPGQAVSYKIGMLTILELREKAMNALGDKFNYGEFHDVVLSNGSVPLTLLSEEVDGWIAGKL